MRILDITLHNYKIHRDTTIKFEKGVTGICGVNGSGKSSIISAITFLLTGELDVNSKAEAIRLGETEGWVSGHFLLNEKEGYIERHLSTAKVILRYDGKNLNKAGEVKELWAELMQIDNTIFKNVIVAAQGDIALLFSGDASVREKVFQKIFMVPPTEKLRSTIWNYIKNCPPELPEEDELPLQNQQVDLAARIKQHNKDLDGIQSRTLDSATLLSVNGRIGYLKQCIVDTERRPAFEARLAAAHQTYNVVVKANQEEKAALDAFDVQEFKKQLNEQVTKKERHIQYNRLYDEWLRITTIGTTIWAEATFPARVKQLEVDKQVLADLNAKVAGLRDNLNKLRTQKRDVADLQQHTVCPTCQQEITDTEARLQHINNEMAYVQNELNIIAQEAEAKRAYVNRESEVVKELQQTEQKVKLIREQMVNIGDKDYNPEDIYVLTEAINQYEKRQKEFYENLRIETQAKADIQIVQAELRNLKTYDGELTADEELQLMMDVLVHNDVLKKDANLIRVQIAELQKEFDLLDQRIAASTVNRNKNLKRKNYLSVLQSVYDILHSSCFPRALIQSYSQYVEYYLKLNLQNFNIPYEVTIGDSFNLIVKNEQGVLPDVSGGQAIVLGLCLRLALHRLFSQSFSMWIVDEGTTHMDEENKKRYFNLIAGLKKEALIDQIIIIDHEKQLTSVVDNVIQL